MVRLKIPEYVEIKILFWRGTTQFNASSFNKMQNVSGTGDFNDYIMFPCFANQSTVSFGIKLSSNETQQQQQQQQLNISGSVFDFEVETFITGCLYYNETTSFWSTDGCWVSC